MREVTIEDIFNTLDVKQRQYVYHKIGQVLEESLSIAAASNFILRRPDFTKDQKKVIIHIIEAAGA